MPVIHRYVGREILKYIGIVLVTVVGIYLVVDFFERVDNFLGENLPVSRALVYLVYKIPLIIAQILPVAILLAVLITFGLMAKTNELIALKSSGVSIRYLLRPVLWIGILSTGFLFLFSEVLVPVTSANANRIWLLEVRQKSAVISREKNIWLKDNRLINHIRYYDKTRGIVHGISLFYFDDAFRLSRRLDASRGVFEGGDTWVFHDILEQVLNPDGAYSVNSYEERVETVSFTPESLKIVVKKSEEMSYRELRNYVKRVEAEGYDATPYRVDLYAKIAFPFICLILSVLGIGIAAGGRVRENLPVVIAFGIGIAFLYWIFYSFCLSLGYGGMLPPVVAAWTANVVFMSFALFKLMGTE
jgi:lipopolysaccharide export system permease protein